MTDNINIQGLDKAEILAALYNRSKPLVLGFLDARQENMTIEEAQIEIEKRDGNLAFDYLNGRVMKVNLSGDTFHPGAYDYNLGHGAAQSVVSALREGKEPPKNSSDFENELDTLLQSPQPSEICQNGIMLGLDDELIRALKNKRPDFKPKPDADSSCFYS